MPEDIVDALPDPAFPFDIVLPAHVTGNGYDAGIKQDRVSRDLKARHCTGSFGVQRCGTAGH